VGDHRLEFVHELEKTGKVLIAHDAAMLAQVTVAVLQRQQTRDAAEAGEPPTMGMARHSLLRARIGGR
jgi:hypothetical protein